MLLDICPPGDLVSGGGPLATLPVDCWPMRKLIFSKALNSEAVEVDVNEFGEAQNSGLHLKTS